jgi:hypothetical protein
MLRVLLRICVLFIRYLFDYTHKCNKDQLQLSPEDIAALTQESRALRAEAEERERLLSSTQQLLKIAQEQLFKGASSQGETRGQM